MKIRRLLRVSRREISRQTQDINLRLIIAALLIVGITAGVGVISGPPDIEQNLYTVGITEDSQYETAFKDATQFQVEYYSDSEKLKQDAQNGRNVDLAVFNDGTVAYSSAEKGAAALNAATTSLESFNTRQFEQETDENAAFPVVVSVFYVEQIINPVSEQAGTQSQEGGLDEQTRQEQHEAADELLEQSTESVSPNGIEPPFPFESLIIAFLFVIPMTFIVQIYSSSVIEDRENRKGELMLVTPLSKLDIVFGKTIPYMIAIVGIISVIAAATGAGALAVLALLPFAFAYMSAGFISGLFARSYKELTFAILSTSVFFTLYAFIPAIFANILPIASISPLTVAVLGLQGEAVPLSSLLFSTVPLLTVGILVYGLGLGIYRTEDLFSQKSLYEKFIDALAVRVNSWKSLFLIGALSIPFVFAVSLLAVASLFVIPEAISIPVILVMLAFIEEIAKSIAIYAGIVKKKMSTSIVSVTLAAILSGFGFFVAEKALVVTQSIGLTEVALGEVVFQNFAYMADYTFPLSAFLFIAFLTLHSVTTIFSAIGAKYGKQGYAIGLMMAVLVHVSYNIGVITLYA